MSFNAGAITGSISLATAPLAASVGRARGLMAGLRNSTNGMFAGLGGTAVRIGGLLTAALGGIGVGAALKLSAEFEQAQISFTTMLGSAEQAKRVMGEIEQFAASTPFQFSDLAAASGSLISFGTAAESLIPEMRVLGDLSAGLNIPIKDMADLYGKARVNGRLMMDDINQLTGRGIPIIGELAKQFGVTESAVRDLVSSGKVNFTNLQQAFADLTAEGSKFGGGMAAQSKGLAGLWSTFKDNVSATLRKVGDALVANLNIKGLLEQATASLQAAIPKIVGVATVVASAAASVGKWIAENRVLLTSIGVVVGAIAGITIGVTALITAVALLTSPITLAIAGIAAVGAGIALAMGEGATWTDRLKDGFLKMATAVVSSGVGAFTAVEVAIMNWRDTFALVKASAELSVRGIVGDVVHGLTVSIPEAMGWLSRNWQDLFAGILVYTTGVLENLSKNIRAAFTAIWEFIKSGGTSGFQIDWTPLTEGIHVAFAEEFKLTGRELSTREKELSVQISKIGDRLGGEFGEKMQSRVDATLKALGLKESDPGSEAGDQPTPQSGIKGAANEAGKAVSQVLGGPKLASLNFAGSNEELQLQAKQRLAAAGAPGAPGANDVPKKQLDEQRETNEKLDNLASLMRELISNDQTISIPGV